MKPPIHSKKRQKRQRVQDEAASKDFAIVCNENVPEETNKSGINALLDRSTKPPKAEACDNDHLCPECKICNKRKLSIAFTCLDGCSKEFLSYLEYLQHQAHDHGLVKSGYRVGAELPKTPTIPPATVYIGQQYMYPWIRPSKWSLDRVKEEEDTLLESLYRTQLGGLKFIWKAFKTAAVKARSSTDALQSQYYTALEYHNSSLAFSVPSAREQDAIIAPVGKGCNWLTS